MKGRWLLLLAAVVSLQAGCSSDRPAVGGDAPGGYHGPMMGPMMRGPRAAGSQLTFKSNGQRIYYTATSASGDQITAAGGPPWFQMHGGSCVDCHGPDGKGGYVVPMTDVVAPDITYRALTSSEHEMAEGEHHPPYTEALIKRAIAKGLDPAGDPLDQAMPRWTMSERDLDDLIGYLRVLGGTPGKE